MKTINTNESNSTVETTRAVAPTPFQTFIKKASEEIVDVFAPIRAKWNKLRADSAAAYRARRQREKEALWALLVGFCANPARFVARLVHRLVNELIHSAISLSIIAIAAIMVYNFVQANPDLVAQITEVVIDVWNRVCSAWNSTCDTCDNLVQQTVDILTLQFLFG